MRNISVLGDPSNHGGNLIDTATDDTLRVQGIAVCANGCSHACPIPGHGITQVTAITHRSFINNKLIITSGATAGCGAVIDSPDRRVFVE